MITKPWEGYIKPFKIYGNLYFVGTHPASSHLIDTGEGLILLDSGYPQTLYLVVANIAALGFSVQDIRYIVHSHGHYDHLGGTRALKELTGAKTFLGAADREYANGTLDLTWARELGAQYYESFEPDVLLYDGDTIALGSTVIHCISTPGHTPGTFSFFFEAEENGRKLVCGMHGGVGTNSMEKAFLNRYGLSCQCREDFLCGLEKMRRYSVDITLGNHVWNNRTEEKAELLEKGEENPFIDASEWERFLVERAAHMEQLIADGR